MGLTRITAQQISNIDYKQSVRAVTVSNITLSGGAPATVDGVSLVAGDRILVTGQSTSSQNGLYYVTVLGVGSNGTWARTGDADATGEIDAGMIVMVTEGTLYADTQWKLITNDPITVGTTGLTFTQNYSANSISSGTSNVVVSSSANVSIAVAGSNVAVFASTGEYVTGLVSATGNITGGNVTTAGLISATGNITGGNLTTAGQVSATGNITGGNLSGTNIVGTLTTAAQTNITSVGTLSSLSVTGNVTGGNINTAGLISATGNITGGNISATNHTGTTVSVSGNVTGGNLITAGLISATGNITGGNISATNHTGTTVSVTGNVTGGNILTAGLISATGNITGGNVIATNLTGTLLTAAQTNITSVGTLSALSVTGNTTGGNLLTSGLVSATGNINTAGTVNINSTTGNYNVLNISGTALAPYGTPQTWKFFTNNTALGGSASFILFPDSSTQTTAYPGTSSTLSLTGNITGGNLLTSGLISSTGNITGGNLSGTNIAGTLTTAAQTNITSVGTLGSLSVTGNITGGNILGGANVNATTHTGTTVSVTGNITGGNLLINTDAIITGNLTVNGNTTTINSNTITTNDLAITLGNNQNTGTALNGAGIDVGNNSLATWKFNNATTSWQSNIAVMPTANGTLTLGGTSNYWGAAYVTTLTASGNANVGNLGATNIVGTLTTAAQTNITSVGTLGSLSVTGNITGGNILGGANVNATTHTGTRVSVTGNVNGGNLISAALVQGVTLSATGNVVGGNVTTAGLISATGNITGGNLSGTSIVGTLTTAAQTNITSVGTLGSLSVTGNITGGNLLTSGNIVDTNALSIITGSSGNVSLAPGGTNVLVATTTGANITGTLNATGNANVGNLSTAGQISATGTITTGAGTNSTGFAVGNGAVSNVGLGFFPTAGTRGDYAIRDYSTVFTTMYLDAGVGGTGGGEFQFRASNAFSLLMRANSSGVYSSGIVSATGAVSGLELTSTQSSGDEGGQLNLAKAATNTTLAANVVVDIFQNKLRFFENGGTTRGAFIDLTSCNASVGTNLLSSSGGGGTPGGSNTQVQFNDTGVFGGVAGFTFDKITNTLTANIIASTNNGNGTNFKVGDDIWIGDVNTADTMRVTGQQNGANAYIVFGNTNANSLGRAGSGPLTYTGAFSATGNITGSYILGNGSLLSGLSTSSISNGTSNVVVAASGNVTVGVTGTNNIAEFNTSGLTLLGAHSNPKTISRNITIPDSVNAMLIGPITIANSYNLTVPTGSTAYIYL